MKPIMPTPWLPNPVAAETQTPAADSSSATVRVVYTCSGGHNCDMGRDPETFLHTA